MALETPREQEGPRGVCHDGHTPACEMCDDTGWCPIEERGIRCVRRCDCMVRRRSRFAEGVPNEFQEATLESYRLMAGNREAVAGAREFLASATGDLFIGGPVGCGKTRLVCSVLNGLWLRGTPGYFVHVTRALDQLQPRADDQEARTLARKLATVPFAGLDDLGAERDRASDFSRRTLLMIYEERRDRGLRTIWTSNKRLSELADINDDTRLVSRIAGSSRVTWIALSDQRLAGRGK